MVISVHDENPLNQGQPFTGTTTGTYALAAWLYFGPGAQFMIHNEHASNTMKYKVLFYLADPDGTIPGMPYLMKDETTIAGGATPVVGTNLILEDSVNRPFYKAEVWVQSGTGACDYQIDAYKYP